MPAMLDTTILGRARRQGKVRDVYALTGDRLLMIATDRISAFDWVLPTGIPDKGRVLTGLSVSWFERLGMANHLLGTDLDAVEFLDGSRLEDPVIRDALEGRSMITRQARVVPFECVVRGYLSGSGWKEYKQSGTVCGITLPGGLVESDRLPCPIFTPATKAESGHDENVPFETMAAAIGEPLADHLRAMSLEVYRRASKHAETCGLILADTKLEWGLVADQADPILVDEVLTPDSSRYWPADAYRPGGAQPSFDKQYVRDWLEATTWDKNSTPPTLPDDVVNQTRARYVECYETLTGAAFRWA
jgi:phosphoribosylaminoimidazole-succinocarboxamide synthase